MIYLFSAPLTKYATTNIEKIYQSIEDLNDSHNPSGKYTIYLYNENGELQGVFEGEVGGPTQSFIKFIYDIAKSSKRIDLINWASSEISKYDNTNPTINSLIYSLWEKTHRGTDQTE
jgi:hypothetical protein